MAANLETIIKQLSESSIIAQGKLENFVPPMAHFQTAEELVAELVKQNHLTPFQAQHVKAGKSKALILGNYTILDTIGAGGMGQVFKAEHRRMERIVAIKMLPQAMTKNAMALARFQREVKAAAKLRHPNIVAADDADEANGSHFLVMEYVEGRDLSAYVKKLGPFSVDKAVNYVLQAARGLEFAHGEGVVHRDIKPANLLLDKKGAVKILDMGLARIDVPGGDVAAQAELTGAGAIMGTVDYMAPEQGVNTHDVDARADIYSLGCTLHYLLIGKPVYGGETLGAKFLAHHRQPIPDLTQLRSEVPGAVNDIFQRMVAKQPEDRYQTMSEAIADLQACGVGDDGSLTMQRTISTSSGNSVLKSIKNSGGASARSRKKKAAAASGDKKKLLYGAVGAGAFALLVLTAIVVLLRDNGDIEVAKAAPPTAAVSVAKVVAPVTAPVVTKLSPTVEVRTPVAKIEPAVIKPTVEKPAPASTPSAMTLAPPPVAKVEPLVTKPVINKPAPAAKASEKKPAPIVVARVEPPIAKPTAIDANPTTPPATKAPAPAPAAKAEPEVKKNARLTIPSAAALMKAEQLVQDLFKSELAQAKLPDQKMALVEKILSQADITRNDPAAKYAMLQAALRLAVDVADVRIINETINALATGYVVKPAEIWIETLEKAGKKQRPPAINKSLAQAALKQLEKFDVYDNSELAARLQVASLAPARKARDPALLKEVVERGKTLAAARKRVESIGKVKEVLANDPLDASANLTLGRYLCFVKNDWQQGFTHLSKGSDKVLADLAAQSLAKTTEFSAQTALADAWWKESETAKGTDKGEFQLGAGYCYAQALSQLSGLSRTVAKQRIESLPPKNAQAFLEIAAQRWIDQVAPLPAAQQLEAVSKKLQDLNPGYTGAYTHRIDQGAVTELSIEGKFIADLSPVRALVGLRRLVCAGGGAGLTDISPLRGMHLETLCLSGWNALQDISPLEGMKLVTLDLAGTQVEDFTPLQGMPLKSLNLYGAGRVRDLSPLQGMKLTNLVLRFCPVSDLEPLRGMPLTAIALTGPQIQDFSPLQGMNLTRLEVAGCTNFQNLELVRGMKLTALAIDGAGVTDLSPLRGMPLESVNLTPKLILTGMDLLRNMKSIRTISVGGKGSWPAAEFWTRYDRGEFK